jgi:hypothetical protein
VFVVAGVVECEGPEVIAVTTSRKLANVAVTSDKAIRKASERFPFDGYLITPYMLDTAVYHTNFFTKKIVRGL